MRLTRRDAISLLASAAALSAGRAPARTAPEMLNRPPRIDPATARRIAPGVTVIEDPRINLVPNVGVVEGRDAVLVVDTGLGPRNGETVLALARRIADGRDILLTLTHFHPEHAFGASVFADGARILCNRAQAEELADKGQAYLDMFRGFGPHVAAELEGTVLVEPHECHDDQRVLDLGGRKVILTEMPAHTRGDQVVLLPDEGILFTGDLVENAFFPILPDGDSSVLLWMERLDSMRALGAQTIVPGHGAVGEPALIDPWEGYFAFVEEGVAHAVARGLSPAETDAELTPLVQRRHAEWDNPFWAAFAVRILHAELSGQPLELPPF